MQIHDPVPTIEAILEAHRDALGDDHAAYRNHVYRVWHYAVAFCGGPVSDTVEAVSEADKEKIAVAGCFHDLGIWTHGTFDYLEPSADMARQYLAEQGRPEDFHDVGRMIHQHHKITRFKAPDGALVEAFRRADWLDVTQGRRRFGLDRATSRAIYRAFPSLGFFRRLQQLSLKRLREAPLRPLPMFKW
ncbi:MAG: HD domain-containing protein [Acidobacteriota bacterium]